MPPWKTTAQPVRAPALVSPPQWWPHNKSIPITHVFRSMRADLDDLKHTQHNVHHVDHDSDNMRREVLRAVVHGSTERSPFLHTSRSMEAAQCYAAMGRVDRGEEMHSQMMVKIDLWGWYQTGTLKEHTIIDLSSTQALKKYFTNPPDMYGKLFQDNFALGARRNESSKEIQLKWRGTLPLEFMEVIGQ